MKNYFNTESLNDETSDEVKPQAKLPNEPKTFAIVYFTLTAAIRLVNYKFKIKIFRLFNIIIIYKWSILT